jgi:hypothetical protein
VFNKPFHKVKVIGAPIGATDEPHDGDGDGKYTAVRGGEDNTPMPAQLFDADDYLEFRTEPDWEDDDILDPKVMDQQGYTDPTDYDEFYYDAKEEWNFWNPCRGIRQMAYWLAGLGSDDTQDRAKPADPHLEFGESVVNKQNARLRIAQARILLAEIAKSGKQRKPLYRAVQLSDKENETFFEAVKEGEEIAIPLLATASKRSIANEEMLESFGRDVLIVVEPGARGVGAGTFPAHYTWKDEQAGVEDADEYVSNVLEPFLDEIDEELAKDDPVDEERLMLIGQRKEVAEDIAEAQKAINEYRILLNKIISLSENDRPIPEEDSRRLTELQQEVFSRVDPDILPPRLAGEKIDESDDDFYWDRNEYPTEDESVVEVITGGRFLVTGIEDDARGRYGKVVKLRQLATFHPLRPGQMILTDDAPKPKKKVAVLWL